MLSVLAAVAVLAPGEGMGRDGASFRVAFSSSMFTDVNENDAKAAVKVWSQTVARERGIEVDPDARIYKDMPSLSLALESEQVDAVGILTTEYETLSAKMKLTPIFVTRVGGRLDEEYLLLVHRESQIQSVGDLRGRSLLVYRNARACLASAWLDTLLVRNGFRPSVEFFGRVSGHVNPSKVVLPVFFRQSDACLVTRGAFELLNELNPQTGRQLKVLASSPALVPAVFCFRGSYASPVKDRVVAALRELHSSPAGQQVLTIFRSERLEEHPASLLQSALDLVAEHRRVCGSAGRAGARLSEAPGNPATLGSAPGFQPRGNL